MHDPMTHVFDLRIFSWDILTIWHRDPEKDGSDDSCGWCRPKLTAAQKERLKGCAWAEASEPWFFALKAKTRSDARGEQILRSIIAMVNSVLKFGWTWDRICLLANRLYNNHHDNFRSSLCHLPGYHTNFNEDRESEREDCAYHTFASIASCMMMEDRPWWKHPRWHFWHWRLQFRPWQNLKRRWWDKCCICGKRGFSEPAIGNWDGDKIWHQSCNAKTGPSPNEVLDHSHPER